MRHTAFLLLIAWLATAWPPGAGSAAAHAFLSQAAPAVGGVVSAPPREIRLVFTEAVEPAFSRIELSTAEGQPIAAGPARVDPSDGTQLVLSLPFLAAGRYRVRWHVVSV